MRNRRFNFAPCPTTDVQQAHFASFRSRVNEIISATGCQVANIVEAEQLVWSEPGEELMSVNLLACGTDAAIKLLVRERRDVLGSYQHQCHLYSAPTGILKS